MARKKIYRAGVIPYHVVDGKIEMLFMKPSDKKFGGDMWQVAKGKQEENETIEETALREAREELGLFKGNIKRLDSIGEWLGRTTFFIAHIDDKDMFGEPHFETKETKWLTLEQFIEHGRDIHKPVVRAAVRKIDKIRIRSHKELAEAPQYISPTQFDFDKLEINQSVAERILSEPHKVLIGKSDDTSLYAVNDEVALIDEQDKEVLYYVDYQIEHLELINQDVISQVSVWANRFRSETENVAKKIFFEFLFKKTHAIMTDSKQTFKGERFWASRLNDAFKMGLNVYFVKLDAPQIIKKVNTSRELTSIVRQHDVWGPSSLHTRKRMIITNKTFEETDEQDNT